MPITIDEMSTEVVAEPPTALAGAAQMPAGDRDDEVAKIRFALAIAARVEQRLAAEGYDD